MLRTTDAAYTRMLEEKANLQKKVEALAEFIKKARHGEIANIELAEIHLLEEQCFYMNGYLRILNIRISRVK